MSAMIIDSATPLTEAEIADVEKRMRRPIPPAYRTFLLAHNGGRPTHGVFSIHGEHGIPHNRSRVRWFLGVNTGKEYNNLEATLEAYRGRLPSTLFPIAKDPFGNLICLVDGEDKGSVYFWDHEREVETPTHDNVFFVAHSFDAFLYSLLGDGTR